MKIGWSSCYLKISLLAMPSRCCVAAMSTVSHRSFVRSAISCPASGSPSLSFPIIFFSTHFRTSPNVWLCAFFTVLFLPTFIFFACSLRYVKCSCSCSIGQLFAFLFTCQCSGSSTCPEIKQKNTFLLFISSYKKSFFYCSFSLMKLLIRE